MFAPSRCISIIKTAEAYPVEHAASARMVALTGAFVSALHFTQQLHFLCLLCLTWGLSLRLPAAKMRACDHSHGTLAMTTTTHT